MTVTPAWHTERDEMMFYCRQLGMPLEKIGERFSLSTERVRMILKKRERMAELAIDESQWIERLVEGQYNPKTHAAKAALSLTGIAEKRPEHGKTNPSN